MSTSVFLVGDGFTAFWMVDEPAFSYASRINCGIGSIPLPGIGLNGLLARQASDTSVFISIKGRVRRPDLRITPRQLQLLQLLVEGFNRKQIASRLGISDRTVTFHQSELLRALQCRSVCEAVARAVDLKLIEVEYTQDRRVFLDGKRR